MSYVLLCLSCILLPWHLQGRWSGTWWVEARTRSPCVPPLPGSGNTSVSSRPRWNPEENYVFVKYLYICTSVQRQKARRDPSNPWLNLNHRLDLQSFLWSMCTTGWDQQAFPIPPHLSSHTRALLASQDRRHLFVTPLKPTTLVFNFWGRPKKKRNIFYIPERTNYFLLDTRDGTR
jgi:hypothetical protein